MADALEPDRRRLPAGARHRLTTGTAAATPQLLTTPTGVFDVIALIVLAAAWTAAAIWFVTKPKELS